MGLFCYGCGELGARRSFFIRLAMPRDLLTFLGGPTATKAIKPCDCYDLQGSCSPFVRSISRMVLGFQGTQREMHGGKSTKREQRPFTKPPPSVVETNGIVCIFNLLQRFCPISYRPESHSSRLSGRKGPYFSIRRAPGQF